MSFLVIALAILAVAVTGYGTFVRPAARRHEAALVAPEPQPEPRVPCDLDRPYPRPKGGRRRQDSTCPVCGTGDTTGALDGRVLGWRAHASCAEWLGGWKPPSPEIKELQRALDSFEDRTIPVLALKTAGGPVIQHPCPGCGMEFTGRASEIVLALNIHQQNGECERNRREHATVALPRNYGCCDGCGAPLGVGVRYHDPAGYRWCPACDGEQRRRKQGAYAPPSPPPPSVPTPAEYLAEPKEHLHKFGMEYPDDPGPIEIS
jgi:hypothetical protein